VPCEHLAVFGDAPAVFRALYYCDKKFHLGFLGDEDDGFHARVWRCIAYQRFKGDSPLTFSVQTGEKY
jgi:hypothetical protein